MKYQRILYIIGLSCSCWLLSLNIASYADMPKIKLEQVQAVYLFRFIQFIRWPSAAMNNGNSDIHMCVLGDDPYGKTLDDAMKKGERVRNITINVHRLRRPQQVQAMGCHVLFISQSEVYEQARILRELARQPILTVSEVSDFAEQGGMIQFVRDNTKVRLIVNQKALENVGLRASSRLLTIAKTLPPYE